MFPLFFPLFLEPCRESLDVRILIAVLILIAVVVHVAVMVLIAVLVLLAAFLLFFRVPFVFLLLLFPHSFRVLLDFPVVLHPVLDPLFLGFPWYASCRVASCGFLLGADFWSVHGVILLLAVHEIVHVDLFLFILVLSRLGVRDVLGSYIYVRAFVYPESSLDTAMPPELGPFLVVPVFADIEGVSIECGRSYFL